MKEPAKRAPSMRAWGLSPPPTQSSPSFCAGVQFSEGYEQIILTMSSSLRAGSLVVVGPHFPRPVRRPFAFSRGPTTTSEPARRLDIPILPALRHPFAFSRGPTTSGPARRLDEQERYRPEQLFGGRHQYNFCQIDFCDS